MESLRIVVIFVIFYGNYFIVSNAILVENNDRVPRIMYWWGWVNNRIDETTGWQFQTDPDGVSGANLDMLTYCRKFYPLTKMVRYYKNETSLNWYSRGNVRIPPGTYCQDTCKFASYECVQTLIGNPRIMYLSGKVNQHTSYTTGWKWVTDADMVSSSSIDPLIYCKKLFPATVAVHPFTREDSSTWVDISTGSGNNVGGSISMECVQKDNFIYTA